MRTTVDIPDSLYRELKRYAATEGTTMKKLILEGLRYRLQNRNLRKKPEGSLSLPLIRSKRSGTLVFGEEGVYEFIPFP